MKNIWSHCGHILHKCFNCCFDPLYCVNFYYHSLPLQTVEGHWLQFSVAPTPPFQLHSLLSQTCNAILPLCLSQSHSDSLPRLALLLWLGFMGCCHELQVHYPCIIIHIAHGIMYMLAKLWKRQPLSIFEPHSHSTPWGISAVLHSVPPPIGLNMVSLSLSSLDVIYKNLH